MKLPIEYSKKTRFLLARRCNNDIWVKHQTFVYIYIYECIFFAMYEICVHTTFEPSAKKHIPFFSCFAKN
jgi:hypothetical protein